MTNTPRMQTDMLDTTHRYGKPASDLKNAYLTREHTQMMQIAPVIARK